MQNLDLCQFDKEDVVVKRLVVTGLVFDRSGWLLWVKYGSTYNPQVRSYKIYDGFDTSDEPIIDTYNMLITSLHIVLRTPIRIKKGLYVYLDRSSSRICFGFVPDY